MELESEKQTFILKDFKLVSNNEFEIIEINFDGFNIKCLGTTSDDNNQVDLKTSCPYFYKPQQLPSNSLIFKIRTKHGGIISIIKFINPLNGSVLP